MKSDFEHQIKKGLSIPGAASYTRLGTPPERRRASAYLEAVHLAAAHVVVHGAAENVHGIMYDGGGVEKPAGGQLRVRRRHDRRPRLRVQVETVAARTRLVPQQGGHRIVLENVCMFPTRRRFNSTFFERKCGILRHRTRHDRNNGQRAAVATFTPPQHMTLFIDERLTRCRICGCTIKTFPVPIQHRPDQSSAAL